MDAGFKAATMAKQIIRDNIEYTKVSDLYGQVYFTTTENIKEYFRILDWSQAKRILTVCSSGDHPLNASYYGAEDIINFDINILTDYFFQFKLAAVKTYSYQEYLHYFNQLPVNDFSTEMINYQNIRTNINLQYQFFWDYLYHDASSTIIKKLCRIYVSPNEAINRNEYLNCKENYNQLKRNLQNCQFTFYNSHLYHIIQTPGLYDKIFLSNINDYLIEGLANDNQIAYTYFKTYITKFLSEMITPAGEIVASYFYDAFDIGTFRNSFSATNRQILKRCLSDELIEYYFPSTNKRGNQPYLDSVMIYKKSYKNIDK